MKSFLKKKAKKMTLILKILSPLPTNKVAMFVLELHARVMGQAGEVRSNRFPLGPTSRKPLKQQLNFRVGPLAVSDRIMGCSN